MPLPPGYEGDYKLHQVNIVGWVLLITTLIPLPLTYIQWKKRNHPIMRYRTPALLFVVLWLGVPICALLDAAFYAGYPFLPCEILFWNVFTIFQFVAYPYVLRSWKLLWLYRTTRRRVMQHEFNLTQASLPTNTMGTWLAKHKWMADDTFLMKAWAFGFVIHIFPALILQIHYRKELHEPSPIEGYWCAELPAQYAFTLFYGFIYIVTVVSLSVFLIKADDAYYIKDEYRAASLIWLFMLIMWIVWLENPPLYSRFPTYFWIGMGFLGGIGVNCVWLTYKLLHETEERVPDKVYTKTPMRESSSLSSIAYPGRLRDLLSGDNFRQEFYEFLVLEFCVENLMFWEEVKRWKEGDRNLAAAKKIYKRFVAMNAVDQVNLSFENAGACKQLLKSCSVENPPPPTLFDPCVDEVVNMMDNDSLFRFRVFLKDKKAAARLAATNVPKRPPTTSLENLTKMEMLKEKMNENMNANLSISSINNNNNNHHHSTELILGTKTFEALEVEGHEETQSEMEDTL